MESKPYEHVHVFLQIVSTASEKDCEKLVAYLRMGFDGMRLSLVPGAKHDLDLVNCRIDRAYGTESHLHLDGDALVGEFARHLGPWLQYPVFRHFRIQHVPTGKEKLLTAL